MGAYFFVVPGWSAGPGPEPMNTGDSQVGRGLCSWVPGSRAAPEPRNDVYFIFPDGLESRAPEPAPGLNRGQLPSPSGPGFPASRRAVRGKLTGSSCGRFPTNFASQSPLPGLVPGIHVLRQRQSPRRRRGWPDQVRPRGSSLVAQNCGLATVSVSPDSPALARE